ncbi:hypothetical protein POPTR_004G094650v4 [Populus trichocarpa]|uniref:Uncharacterized protein n=1 Tax=Populus trichocarpa TaxID=3694 RepID=A0ACC0T4E4_POPTR|nr:hypothetical protein BDE02_04G081300 [Populus trichocarpa]KAI9396210.1 hypothetical protein POPTR_004G094650v4 [Populus trichocarpa]
MEEVEEIGKERKWLITWGGFVEELKEVSYIAAPMVAVTVLQYLLQVVSVIIVGHLGQLALSGVALATSINNVTGFSLLVRGGVYPVNSRACKLNVDADTQASP